MTAPSTAAAWRRTVLASIVGASLLVPGARAHAAGIPCDAAETLAAGGSNPAPSVMPTLQNWRGGTGSMRLTSRSRIVFDDAALRPVAQRLAADVAEVAGLRLRTLSTVDVRAGDIVLSLSVCGPHAVAEVGAEGGTINVNRHAALRATTPRGVLFATRTLLQMLMLDGATAGRHRDVVRGGSTDRPLYHERAIMLDVARKFAPKEFLVQYIRFMGWYKFNTLHLHLNDFAVDASGKEVASFRLKSKNPSFRGPVSDDGLYYTRADWRELEAEAAANGITIVPEFDTPGHSQAFTRARPDLASPKGFLDPTKPETLAYVKSVYDEFLPWFASPVIHMGGDEVDDFRPDQIVPYLNDLASHLRSKGRSVQAWGDYNYLATYNPRLTAGLDRSVWIQRWINWNPEASVNYGQSGYRWTDSYGDWYIVPKGPKYFNPDGLAGSAVYDGWFGKPETGLKPFLPVGGQIAVWHDRGASHDYDYAQEVHRLLRNAVPAAGQVYWSGQSRNEKGGVIPYSVVATSVASLGYGPGTSGLADAPSASR